MKYHISSKILLLAQDRLVAIKLSVETFEKFGGDSVIRRQSHEGLENLLRNSFGGKGIEVAGLDRNCLVVQSSSLQLGRDET